MDFPPFSFRSLRHRLGLPTWLVGDPDAEGANPGESTLIGYSLDTIKDAFVKRAYLGLLARFPWNGPNGPTAPADALAAIGRDRKIVRGINESLESYANRLVPWLDKHRVRGNAFSLLDEIADYCGPGVVLRTVDVNGNWYTRNADGSRSYVWRQANWNWDGDFSGVHWSRFWVIIYPPSTLWLPQPNNWGDAAGPSWGTPTNTWGSTATADQVATIRQIVADWMSTGQCINIIVAFDPTSFSPSAPLGAGGMPDGLWFRWSKNVGGVQVPARLSTARYWDGVSK